MVFTSDDLPVVATAPGLPNVWVAGGVSGHGMSFGPRLGQLLTQAVTTGVLPGALAPLRMDRPTLTPLVAAARRRGTARWCYWSCCRPRARSSPVITGMLSSRAPSS